MRKLILASLTISSALGAQTPAAAPAPRTRPLRGSLAQRLTTLRLPRQLGRDLGLQLTNDTRFHRLRQLSSHRCHGITPICCWNGDGPVGRAHHEVISSGHRWNRRLTSFSADRTSNERVNFLPAHPPHSNATADGS